MNFSAVLSRIADHLAATGCRFAVVGGVALAALGRPRTTLDLDLLVEAETQDGLVRFLEGEGYETLHRSAGFSNHLHADPVRGRVDLIYVEPGTARRIFAAAREVRGPGERRILVPSPEHLAAMKVAAMKNDPARTFQELADIRYLLTLPGVDRAAVRAQFERHGLGGSFDELEATL
jgi:hypothetical protein